MFSFSQDQAQLSKVVNFLCKLVSPCQEKEEKTEEKDTEETEKTAEAQKKEEKEEDLVNVSELDVESFQRLVVSARSVANTRPSNLAKYTLLPGQQTTEGKSVNGTVHEFLKELLCLLFALTYNVIMSLKHSQVFDKINLKNKCHTYYVPYPYIIQHCMDLVVHALCCWSFLKEHIVQHSVWSLSVMLHGPWYFQSLCIYCVASHSAYTNLIISHSA